MAVAEIELNDVEICDFYDNKFNVIHKPIYLFMYVFDTTEKGLESIS